MSPAHLNIRQVIAMRKIGWQNCRPEMESSGTGSDNIDTIAACGIGISYKFMAGIVHRYPGFLMTNYKIGGTSIINLNGESGVLPACQTIDIQTAGYITQCGPALNPD